METELQTFLSKANFKKNGKIYYGTIQERFVSLLLFGKDIKVAFNYPANILDKTTNAIIMDSESLKIKYPEIKDVTFESYALCLIFYKNYSLSSNLINAILDEITILNNYDIPKENVCSICGNVLSNNHHFYSLEGTIIDAHDDCISTHIKNEKLNECTSNQKLIRTIIASLISFVCGSLVCFLSVIINKNFNIFFTILSLICLFYSSKFSFGIIKKVSLKYNTIFVTILTSFLSILLIYFSFSFYLYSQDKSQTFNYYLTHIFTYLENTNYLKEVIISYVVGLFILYANIKAFVESTLLKYYNDSNVKLIKEK